MQVSGFINRLASSLRPSLKSNIVTNLTQKRSYVRAEFKPSSHVQPLTERQEGLIITGIPEEWCTGKNLSMALNAAGVHVDESNVLFMRSRLGRDTGRALILCEESPAKDLNVIMDADVNVRLADRFDVELFVEQAERYDRQSEDLRRLAQPENFKRVVTLTDLPRTYGRREVAEMLREHAHVNVAPEDIVFRFKVKGVQSDMAWVICPTERDADQVISKVQELPVPKRVHYGGLYGTAFVWASRLSLFVQHESLDYTFHRSDPYKAKFQVFTTGWQGDVTQEAFDALAQELRLASYGSQEVPQQDGKAYLMQCSDMQHAKRVMTSLNMLKRRWKIATHQPFFAYPKQADVHFADEAIHRDESLEDDSDLDEPIHY